MDTNRIYWLALGAYGVTTLGSGVSALSASGPSVESATSAVFGGVLFVVAIAGVLDHEELVDLPSWMEYAGIVGGFVAAGLVLFRLFA